MEFRQAVVRNQVAISLEVAPSTIGQYWERYDRSGLRWEEARLMTEAELELHLYPIENRPSGSRPAPDFNLIHHELKRPGVTLRLLWEEYMDQHPDGYKYTQFCEHYRSFTRGLKVWMRQGHKAGETTFVDYSGKRPGIVNRKTGEITPVELFVMCWGASHYVYAEAQESQQLRHWLMGHVRAFEFFGCVSKIVVPDNLKSGVTHAHQYDPDINMLYEEMASHYGVCVLPARPRKPKDKAKAENAVLLVQRWCLARLRNRIFFSLEELNVAIFDLVKELNGRPMQKLGRSRAELFEELDRPHAQALPQHRYVYRKQVSATVGLDYHVEVEKCYYSVPYTLYGRRLDIRISENSIEILDRGERVAIHQKSMKSHSYRTKLEHMPERHRKHVQWTPARIVRWAGQWGTHTENLVKTIIDRKPHPEQGFRPALGIKRLGDSYGRETLEAAAEYALRFGLFTVGQVHTVLKKKLYLENDKEPIPGTVQPRSNIRGNPYYTQNRKEENDGRNYPETAGSETGLHGPEAGGDEPEPPIWQAG